MRLNITPRAQADLVDIWLYTFGSWGAEQADTYLDKLESGLQHLTAYPRLGIDYSHIRADYRKYRAQHHDVFYKIRGSQILIVRVLHKDMDAPRRLAD